ncbi:hypothetical protein [Flagellimonas meridianipacifica]|uniref:Uncharacterized protein DUF4331 n=1 Tax=Flagellimonas meridianipacifica TaxID=1080225 RepID=A0A2T0MA17_9FLAO|nr:hypothetical protein [Allomuricauda pacifica]PRX54318.1 uncharacterized protein DUF4331 [Allomuricauda pacifica]
MKTQLIKIFFASFLMGLLTVSCNNDDDVMLPDDMGMEDDGMMMEDDGMMGVDFSGTFAQVDYMGRPGINTTLSFDMEGQPSVKDAHNVTIPSEMVATFQPGFQARLEQYHDVYALKLGLDPMAVDYENNILGLTAEQLTTVLAADALDVAPDLPTTYFNPGTDFDNDGIILVPDGDEVALTGRTPSDDIIDVSLILFFGGAQGDRFSGQDLDDDGTADLPRLTSDGVGLTADISTDFPYLGDPE